MDLSPFSSLDFLQPDQQKRVLEAHLRAMQQQLAFAIRMDDDRRVNELTTELLHENIPYHIKFFNLNFKQLLLENSNNINSLKSLKEGLLILQKYGKNLLLPPSDRPKNWRIVSFRFGDGLDSFKDVFHNFGYTNGKSQELIFPDSHQPDMGHVALIMANIALAIKELDSYLQGIHPFCSNFDECIQPTSQIKQRASGFLSSRNSLPNNEPVALSELKLTDDNHSLSYLNSANQTYNFSNRSTKSYNFSPSSNTNSSFQALHSSLSSPKYEFTEVQKSRHNQFSEKNTATSLSKVDDYCSVCGREYWCFFCSKCGDMKFTCKKCKITCHGHPDRVNHIVLDFTQTLCDSCGVEKAQWVCLQCDMKLLCTHCNETWHRHPRRMKHSPIFCKYTEVSITKKEIEGASASSLVDPQIVLDNELLSDVGASGPRVRSEPENVRPYNGHATGNPPLSDPHVSLMQSELNFQIYRHMLPEHKVTNNSVQSEPMPFHKSNEEYLQLNEKSQFRDVYYLPKRDNFFKEQPFLQTVQDILKKGFSKQESSKQPQVKYVVANQQLKENCTESESENEVFEDAHELVLPNVIVNNNDINFVIETTNSDHLKLLQLAKNQVFEIEQSGLNFVQNIRRLELARFDFDEIIFAETKCSGVNAASWLQDDWSNLQQLIQKQFSEQQGVTGGLTLESSELKNALISTAGDICSTVTLCKEISDNKVKRLAESLWCNTDTALMALSTNGGKLTDACKTVHEAVVAEFCSTWKSNGKENLCGTLEELLSQIDDRQRKVRLLLVELELSGWANGENILTLWDKFAGNDLVKLADVVDAFKNCTNLDEMQSFLQWECTLCFGKFPAGRFLKLNACECKICKECLHDYFNVQIREKHVTAWTCPVCQNPDIQESSEVAATHLQLLDETLKLIMTNDIHELFERKLRDWHLMSDANFRWCQGGGAGCGSGSIYHVEPDQLRIVCQECGKAMCFLCRKPWEDQHKGLSCEAFTQWKNDNDAEHQAQALANYLEDNGIDCPRCKFRFALAKGGCMHFKCNRCGFEFCCGCNEPFRHGNSCKKFSDCGLKGLHCHHPRDCLYFMRDMTVESLCKLLQDNKVAFNQGQQSSSSQYCSVMEQKESGTNLKDEACGREAKESYGGLCEMHYKEYLVGLINKHCIDPLMVWSVEDMENELKRNNKTCLTTKPSERKKALKKLIQEEIPLRRKDIENNDS